jgi:hypothetical protein
MRRATQTALHQLPDSRSLHWRDRPVAGGDPRRRAASVLRPAWFPVDEHVAMLVVELVLPPLMVLAAKRVA